MHPGHPPAPLPSLGDAFTVRSALAAGVGRERLRRLDLNRDVHGVRATRAPESMPDRARLFARRLPPAAFFSHSTAALIHGAPLPWRLENTRDLHVTVAPPARAPHARGLRGHRRVVLEGDVVELDGLRVAAPARVWCELAADLGLGDLVAVGDYFIHHSRSLANTLDLAWRVEHAVRTGGLATLRAALPLLDDRAESRPESLVRVLFASADLFPQINHVLVLTETGQERRPDFVFATERLIVEYQGDYHRTREQWRKDMTRRAELEVAGWRVLEINWDDLQRPRALLLRVRALLSR